MTVNQENRGRIMAEGKEEEKNEYISGEEFLKRLPRREVREFGFLILGVVFGAVLGILGSLWVTFLVELLRNLIPPELWTLVSLLGLVITTILSIYILVKVIQISVKYIRGEEEYFPIEELFTDDTEEEEA